MNGARTTNNSFVFNGIDVTNLLCCNSRINGSRGTIDAGGGTLSRNIAPAPETLEEVKLQTSLYDAATGRNGGGNFQVVSKSGTNALQRHRSITTTRTTRSWPTTSSSSAPGSTSRCCGGNEGGFTIGGPIVKNRTFFFGSYQATRAETSFVDEASNTGARAARADRRPIGRRHQPVRRGHLESVVNGPVNFSRRSTRSRGRCCRRASLTARSSCRRDRTASTAASARISSRESCEVVSIIPATFKQDQFSLNLDHQLATSNRLSGKFFFSNQPSRDPLATAATR